MKSPDPKVADADPVTFTVTADFSDYGVPVAVEPPVLK